MGVQRDRPQDAVLCLDFAEVHTRDPEEGEGQVGESRKGVCDNSCSV